MRREQEGKLIIPDGSDVYKHYAEAIAQETQSSSALLTKRSDEVSSLFKEERSIIVVDQEDESLMSHASLSYIYPDVPAVEIGTVFTTPMHRGKGAAQQAVLGAVAWAKEQYKGNIIFAIAHPASMGMFEKIGAREMQPGVLYPIGWARDSVAPIKKKYDLTNIKVD